MKKKDEIVQWKIPTMPNGKALAKTRDGLVGKANSFVIKTEDHYTASWALVQLIDSAIATVEEPFEPFVSGLHYLHKMAIKLRDSFLDPLYASKQRLMTIRRTFRDEQEEIKRKADAAAAEVLRKTQQRELERQAKAAEKAGQPEVAVVLREEKVSMPLPFLNPTPAVPKQEGSIIRERWIYTIVDPKAVQREYCSPDDRIIRPIVEKLGPACKIEGLEIKLDKSEHSRTVA